MMTELRRPCSIGEMGAVLNRFRSQEALERGLGIAVRPTDVFISTYPKSGTTWLQHVAHGLRSGGSLDFEEISDVVPWLETVFDLGGDPDADQLWHPRLFKAHLEWSRIPKGGRYITVFRDASSVLVSFYQFFEGWFFEPGSISIDEFGQQWFLGGTPSGSYWEHIVSWSEVIGTPDVLALCYEDMAASSERVPQVVADFMELDLSREQIDRVVFQSSRAFMAANESKFDEHVLRERRAADWGLPPGGASAKVRQEQGNRPVLSAATLMALDVAWRERVTPRLGFANYQDFRASLPNPLGAERR
jgi:hypothetical protein